VLLTRKEKYCIWCKLLISLYPVTELAGLFWVHWSTLIQPQLLHLGLFTVMQLHRKLIWYLHFLTSFNHVCEWSVFWKVLEIEFFLSPGKPWNLFFASPGKFLSLDLVRLGGYCYGDVSVTLMYCAQMTESIIMRSSLDCSPAILVFLYQITCTRFSNPIAQGHFPHWRCEIRWN